MLCSLFGHGPPGFCHFFAFNILIKGHKPVNDTMGCQFNNPVDHCIDKFVVMGGENYYLLEFDQAVVQGGDGFQIQVVGGFVQDQNIGVGQHHPGQHTPDLFPS